MSPGSTSAMPGAPEAVLTGVVLTLNESRHLPDCLASLAWCDRLLVLDSGSTDATQDIARRAGARLVEHPFENYSRQRQQAMDLVSTPWLLFVDADERVSADLALEIRSAIADPSLAAAWIPRRNLFFGRALRGGGWWPDPQLRLLRPACAHFDPARAVHERAEVRGKIGRLAQPLLHINYETRAEFVAKQRGYARLEAARRQAEGWQLKPRNYLLQPPREAWRRLITLGGWTDGLLGLELALRMALYELWVLQAMAAADAR